MEHDHAEKLDMRVSTRRVAENLPPNLFKPSSRIAAACSILSAEMPGEISHFQNTAVRQLHRSTDTEQYSIFCPQEHYLQKVTTKAQQFKPLI